MKGDYIVLRVQRDNHHSLGGTLHQLGGGGGYSKGVFVCSRGQGTKDNRVVGREADLFTIGGKTEAGDKARRVLTYQSSPL